MKRDIAVRLSAGPVVTKVMNDKVPQFTGTADLRMSFAFPPAAKGAVVREGVYRRYTGDTSVPGKGEILVWQPSGSERGVSGGTYR